MAQSGIDGRTQRVFVVALLVSAIVLGFASTPYLPATLGDDAAAQRLRQAVEDAIASVGARRALRAGFVGQAARASHQNGPTAARASAPLGGM